MKREKVIEGTTIRKRTACGSLYVTINGNPPTEVFVVMGKAGGCYSCWSDSLGRLLGMALQDGMPVVRAIKALKGARCPSMIYDEGKQVLSCPDAIAQALEEYMEGLGQKVDIQPETKSQYHADEIMLMHKHAEADCKI